LAFKNGLAFCAKSLIQRRIKVNALIAHVVMPCAKIHPAPEVFAFLPSAAPAENVMLVKVLRSAADITDFIV
jgi:hypothetical protein